MTEESGDEFADLARGLVQALDAWAACVGEPISKDRPARKVLVRALEQERATPECTSRAPIDGPILSYWLRGRRQLLPGTKHNRLPSVEDSAAIARALKLYAPGNAKRLPMIGREIADLAHRLQETAGRGWRRRMGENGCLYSPGQISHGESIGTSVAVASSEAVKPHLTESVPLRANVESTAVTEPELAELFPVEPVTIAVSPGAFGAAVATEAESGVIVAAGITDRTSRPAKKRWIGALALTAAAAVSIGLWTWSGDETPATALRGPARSASPSAHAMDADGPNADTSAVSGSLNGNHRCGRTRSAGTVVWKPCLLVADEAMMAFLVQFTNTSGRPMTVKAKLAYVQASVEQTCPAPWGTSATITIPARATRISPLDTCTAALTPIQAFQAKVWVAPYDATQWAYREHSPTLHVQEAGNPVWADES
ncbi:hypothetical protein [Streptomyces sp. JH34]|uniref:hypothetical protein n=1 Tax=Streptomyces sp. JH34 TaxID=2793633 RepID=UPI0023F8B950|nr:hypothetical protein [Streptomyces sp. JH34]MDF6020935.1 hypothetical protein [Streptomyces sp. JH34]